MTVQEIFNMPVLEEIEDRILLLQRRAERTGWHERETMEIKCLLPIRKRVLNHHFVMDGHYRQLLAEFNDAMRRQLIEMRKETIKAYNAMAEAGIKGEVEAVGKCFLGYEYPKGHPVQTERSKSMWDVLNGTLDDYVSLYWDGVLTPGYKFNGQGDSENKMLYLDDSVDNWNDGLEPDMTRDMHLTYSFHHLYEHTDFSIFDLLWVRDFNIEIHVETD